MSSNNYIEAKKDIEQTERKKGFLVDEDIENICIKHGLSIVEIDRLCDEWQHRNIMQSDKKCGFDKNKPCNQTCKFYSSCTRK